MATSGTTARTTIDVAKLLEHVFRRTGRQPSEQTPQTVQLCKDILYLVLTSLTNRGINLWCVSTFFVGVEDGRQVYETPTGTIDVLNVIYTQPSTSEPVTSTPGANNIVNEYDTEIVGIRFGVKMTSVTATNTLTIESSPDGVTWSVARVETRDDWIPDVWYWSDFTVQQTGMFFRATFSTTAVFSELYIATDVYDLPVTQWNRDTWYAINDKAQKGRPSTSYYFEKLLTPRLTLWPVPNNDYDHLTLAIHRQPQDVGTLTNTLDVPQRWLESIIWQTAARFCYEMPDTPEPVFVRVQAMADRYLLEAEDEESDGAPIYLQPMISAYTK
jgi:hypothetical protein